MAKDEKVSELETKLMRLEGDLGQMKDCLWASQTAQVILDKVGEHTVLTCGRVRGLTQNRNAFEQTARAAVREIQKVVECSAYLLLNLPGSDDSSNLKCYGHDPRNDMTLADLAEFKLLEPHTIRKLEVFGKPFGELYVFKELGDEGKHDVFKQLMLLNNLAPGIARELHRAHTIEAQIQEQTALVRQMCAKDQETRETRKLERKFKIDTLLPTYFQKSSGLDVLGDYIIHACQDNKDISVLFIDVDSFHDYNNTFGHFQGDEALKAIADDLFRHIRHADIQRYKEPANIAKCLLQTPNDFAVRFGGEELVLVLYNTDREHALQVADRMLNSIRAIQIPFHKQNKQPGANYGAFSLPFTSATVSIGVESLNGDYEKTVEELVGNADAAMYWAKNHGKNGARAYDSSMPPAPKK
ncbi:GGDEF domain-containing protein [Candidatus Woesearchaeota archaeon]|nr:GGDEF domain-containing protein [Candidatus Woesearchaeota archaeon]